MEIGIIGLPKSGKTTIFSALTGGVAQSSGHTTAATPNVGVVKVPDTRLDVLKNMLRPKRVVSAEVMYIDVAAPAEGFGKQSGPRGQFLSHLSKVDALVHVVRSFENDHVPHCEGNVDPDRDIEIMNLELLFSDISVVERRLERLRNSLKGAKPQEKEKVLREQELLMRIKSYMEDDIPIRNMNLSEAEQKEIVDFQFLTAKPVLLLFNIGEDQLPMAEKLEAQWAKINSEHLVATLCGQLEMELSQLDNMDAEVFRTTMGFSESGLNKMIRLSYQLLGHISFFTTASEELKAWTVNRSTQIQKAAGKIHTDMEKGFIRAEVISFSDLVHCQSFAEAKRQGLLRLEGKNYIVKDGDVITILFNV